MSRPFELSYSVPVRSRTDIQKSVCKPASKLKRWFSKHAPQTLISDPLPQAQINSSIPGKLPLEIRHQIYNQVLRKFGKAQHILLWKKLTHHRCLIPSSQVYFRFRGRTDGVCDPEDTEFNDGSEDNWNLMGILLSCKQIYQEFSHIIYSSLTFRLDMDPAKRFISTIPASYLALARVHLSLHVSSPLYLPPQAWPVGFTSANTNLKADEAEWEEFWRRFSRVHVRRLEVEIMDSGARVPEQLLLEPINYVQADSIEVFLPWPTGLETTGSFQDAAFTITRQPEGINLMMNWSVDHTSGIVSTGRPFWKRFSRR